MFAKQQSDLILIFRQQGRTKCASRAGCPLRHRRQALRHGLDDLWTTAIDGHSQKIPAVHARRFCVKINRMCQKRMKHLEVAVHCRCHQRREPVFISKIDERASIDEPLRCLPIPLRRRDQQRCPPLCIAPVWIDMFDQAKVNKRRAFNRHRSNQISRRNRDARTGFGRNRRRPKEYQNYDPALASPFGCAHMQDPVANYIRRFEQFNRGRIELRAHLRTSWDWTGPVEHCMFTAVQVPTNAFIHFDYMRGN